RYFGPVPGRVRARLERPAPRVRQVPLRLPAWTWAAAAALVLGVVTPLTMVTLWSTREEPLPVPRPEALAPPTVAASPLADARGDKDKEEMKPGPADDLKLRRAAPASGRNTQPLPAGGAMPATGPARDAFATAPPAAPAEYAVASEPSAPAAAPPSTLGLEKARKRAPLRGGPNAQQQVQTQEQGQAVTPPSAGTVTSAARADEPAAAEAEPKAHRSEPQA